MNHKRVDRIMLYISLGVIPCLVVGVFLFLLWPRNILTVHTYEVYNDVSPMQDRTMKAYDIRAGEEIEFDISFTKRQDVSCEVTVLLKQVDNGYLSPYEHAPAYVTRMPIGSHHYKSKTLIPSATPNGKYVFIRTYRCPVNPLNDFTVSKTSNEFMVRGKAPDYLTVIKEGNKISMENQKLLKELKKK